MSWRTEASNIRAGLASGAYKKKRNYAKAFMEPFQRGIERQELERIQKDKEDRARAASEAKAAAAAQSAKEKADKKLQSMVTLAMITNEIPVNQENNATMLNLAATTGITSVDGFSSFVKDFVKYDAGRAATPLNTVEGTLPPEMQLKQESYTKIYKEELDNILNLPFNKKLVADGRITQEDLNEQAKKMADEWATVGLPPRDDADGNPIPRSVPEPDQAAFAATEAKQMDALGLGEIDPSFTLGKKSSLTKVSDMTEANFRGLIFSAQQRGDEADVANIQGVADSNKWSILLGDKTEAEVMGMTLSKFNEYYKQYSGTLDPSKRELVDNIKVTKETTEADSQFWNDPLKMQKLDVNILEGILQSGSFGPDTKAYTAIDTHLQSRRPFETALKAKEFDLDTFIGQSPDWFEDWLKANSDKDEFNTPEGAVILSRALRFQSTAILREKEEEEEVNRLRTPKDQALQVWFKENGFYTAPQGPPGNVIKKPGSGDFASFEVQWDEALKASKDKDLWADIAKVQNLNVDTLKMIVDAKLLPDGSSELQTVKAALEQRTSQASIEETQKIIELPANLNSAMQAEIWLLSEPGREDELNKPENAATLESFNNIKKILVKNELDIKNEALSNKAVNLYDIAAKEFLRTLDPTLSGQAKIDALATWERDYKASIAPLAAVPTTYTTANYTKDLIEYSKMMTNPNPEVRLVGRNWMSTIKPIIEDSLETVRGFNQDDKIQSLVDEGVDKTLATNIVLGIIKQSTDQYGNNGIWDWRSMSFSTGKSGVGIPVVPVKAEVAGVPPPQEAVNEIPESVVFSFQDVTGEGKQVVVTKQDTEAAVETLSGLASQINNLQDIRSGFGIEGFASKIGNSIFEPFGLTVNAESQEAQTTFKALKTVTILQLVTAVPGIRDSVSLKAQLGQLLSGPGKFTGPAEKILREMKAVKAFVETSLNSARANVNSRTMTPANISKNSMAVNSLTNLAEIYEIAILKMGGGQESGGDDITDSIFVEPKTDAEAHLLRLEALKAQRKAILGGN